MNSRSRTFDAGSSTLGYENFLPEAYFPVIRASVNGEAARALFFLFFSALGFFFSRLLLKWLFANCLYRVKTPISRRTSREGHARPRNHYATLPVKARS